MTHSAGLLPQFVAEVSSNHGRDLGRALAFIDLAADIGCAAIKFQLFKIEELFAPEALHARPDLMDRKDWELPVEFLPKLAEYAHGKGLGFICTPFYIEAVDELLPYVDAYKVASYELPWRDLLIACAGTGRPVILSTGMATLEEIDGAVAAIRGAGCRDLTLLSTISGYPTPIDECNLAFINVLRTRYDAKAGWSDHSVSPGVIARAVHAYGASMVEFHLDLDGTGDEFMTGHCWLPDEIRATIGMINDGFAASGTPDKVLGASELADRDWRADPADGLRPFKSKRESL